MQTSIERIVNIRRTPVPGVNLDLVYVKGYQCVVPTRSYRIGEHVVLIRPETFLLGRFHPYLGSIRPRVRMLNGEGIAVRQCNIKGLRSDAVIVKYHGNGQVGMSMDERFHAEKYMSLVSTIESVPPYSYGSTFKVNLLHGKKYDQIKEIISNVRYFESLEKMEEVLPKKEGYSRIVKDNLGGHFCLFFRTDTDTYVVNKFGIGIRVKALQLNSIYRTVCEEWNPIFQSPYELLIGTIIGHGIRHAAHDMNCVSFITYAKIEKGILTNYRPSIPPIKEIRKKFIVFYIKDVRELSQDEGDVYA